jgi:bacterioferritin (cytochrome b1)
MDKYIHRENLTLLRKRLAEVQDEATRRMIMKLLAEEEAKDNLLLETKRGLPDV